MCESRITHPSVRISLPLPWVLAGDEVWCGGRLCGSSSEMECCSFDPFNCCNKNNQYCDQESCGMIQDGWYCGACGSFDGNSCCNDGLTICQSQVCGHKEDYTCCDVNLRCCTIVPPEPAPTPLYALWWFWVGLIFCLTLLFFIGFVLWSDRHFIKYNIDKARDHQSHFHRVKQREGKGDMKDKE
ncbi:uncharacterized protein LOC134786776 [Penaeus indicus]|uniref:uncharacterized protein LOC134786776 n=1 Tax=Penaeus indicus TaxID=29960 RepID=UPI00300D3740